MRVGVLVAAAAAALLAAAPGQAGATSAAARSAAPEPAAGRAPSPVPVAVVVAERLDLDALARQGAVGLLVPGAGSTVSREASLAALVRGEARNSMLGGLPDGDPVIELAGGPAKGAGAVTIWVELPPPGSRRPNARRYPVAITGGGYTGVLRSAGTRIPGLVSIVDIAPTALALHRGETPPVTSSPASDAPARLARLDARIAATKDASYAAFLAITAATLFFAGLAWLARSLLLARAALLAGTAAICVSFALSLAGVDSSPSLILALSLAAPLGGLLLGAVLRGPRRLAAGCAATIAFVLIALAVRPEAAGLSALGPQPGTGGRFYGLTNALETLLLVPVLLPAALLGLAWLPAAALLALATVGLSRTGADGGGVLVLLVAFMVLALRLRGQRLTVPVVAAVLMAAAALGAALVGLDALAGGSSHVTTAAGGGPLSVVTEIGERLQVSWNKVVHDTGLIIAAVWSLVGLAFAATRKPRSPLIDAFVVALAVSLLVNDSPVHVLAFGVLMSAPLMAWETVRRARRTTT